jgi:hypothetical protein
MLLPGESAGDLDSDRAAWELLEPWDVTPANATLERHAVYSFAARYVSRWRDGRVLLAGDAAHLMPPFAGQGMCAGIRDAANLAWKLDLVLRDGPADLLDTYAEERLPSVRAAIDFSVALGEVICLLDPDAAAGRDEAMSAAVGDGLSEVPEDPPLTGRLVHPTAALAGHLAPQAVVQAGAERGLLDDVLGGGWRLLVADGDPAELAALDAEPVQWLESLGGRVVPLGAGDVADIDGTYARWFEAHDVSWALQRPDFVLYGAARSAADAGRLLGDLRAQLGIASDPTG